MVDPTNLKQFAKDLSVEFPRSPRETLAGYVVAARTLDKCRATVAGTNGEYHFDCPLDKAFFDFTGIDVDNFKAFAASGADDEAVATWIELHSQVKDRREVIAWNNKMRSMRVCDMPIELQEFLEGYIPEFVPEGKVVYVWFDVYDIEEKRI